MEKIAINLVYQGLTENEKGSPIRVELIEQNVKADLIDNFSSYYYNDNQRIMRNSKNFAIPKTFINDKVASGITYELMYVIYNAKKYTIKNILKHKKSSLLVLLDCQEVGK